MTFLGEIPTYKAMLGRKGSRWMVVKYKRKKRGPEGPQFA